MLINFYIFVAARRNQLADQILMRLQSAPESVLVYIWLVYLFTVYGQRMPSLTNSSISLQRNLSSTKNSTIKKPILNEHSSKVLIDSSKMVLDFNQSNEVHSFLETYAPFTVQCPSHSLIRLANRTLNPEEGAYISNRSLLTSEAWAQVLQRNKIPGLDYSEFSMEKDIVIGISFSGGGYRAMLLGAGVLDAMDARSNQNSVLAGLLQSSSYMAGISGGSWLVMSNFLGDNQPVEYMKRNSWSLDKQLLPGVPSFDPVVAQKSLTEIRVEKKENESIVSRIMKLFRGSSKSTEKGSGLFSSMFKPLDTITNSSSKRSTMKEIIDYYTDLHIEVRAKKLAQFPLSFTDYWGRSLARRIFTNIARSPGTTMTSATQLPSFLNFSQPFPIIGAIEKSPLNKNISHLVEFTPFEFGSWGPYLGAFIPMRYLGSKLYDGVSPRVKNKTVSYCTSGFDNAAYITGTLSSLFNHIFFHLHKLITAVNLDADGSLSTVLKPFGLNENHKSVENAQSHPEYALLSPNPFFGCKKCGRDGEEDISLKKHLFLVDGGDDGGNIPIEPFLVGARKVDIVLAYDFTADLENFPNGTTLYHLNQRYNNGISDELHYFRLPYVNENQQTSLENLQNSTFSSKKLFTTRCKFPHVPTPQQFIDGGLSQGPIFLGCDLHQDYQQVQEPVKTYQRPLSNFTYTNLIKPAHKEYSEDLPPLIVYTPNSFFGFASNRSTFQMSYTDEEVDGMLMSGLAMATSSNSSLYAACLNCAILKRRFDRRTMVDKNFVMPSFCKRCFKAYCYKGVS